MIMLMIFALIVLSLLICSIGFIVYML